MNTSLFINFSTGDLDRSRTFYESLGAMYEPDYSGDRSACLQWENNVYFILLTHDYFAEFTSKPLADPQHSAQTMIGLELASREAVDEMHKTILAAGGSENTTPKDHGFMYTISMNDPDGNIIEFITFAAPAT